jgi:hypothetical protein
VVPVKRIIIHPILFLLIGTLLAGCLGGDEPLPGDDLAEEPEAGTGTVTGSIFTVDLNAINGAQVRLVQDVEVAAETTTDPQGRYTLRNVEPGEYRLQVSAACCRENVRAVTVVEDEVTNADLQLEPWTEDDLERPRVERYEWTGFLACTLAWMPPPPPAPGIGGINACGVVEIAADLAGFSATDDDFMYQFEVSRGLKTVVGGIEWRAPGAALGDELWLIFENADQPPNAAPRYANGVGASPIEFRADAGDVIERYEDTDIHDFDFENIEDKFTLQYRMFASGDANVVYQQQFTVYYDLYYWEHAPEDASALPDF